MSQEAELTEIQKQLLGASPIFGEAVAESLNNIFGSEYAVSDNSELVSRLKTHNPHVIVMGFANDDFQGIMFLSFGNISILEEHDLNDEDSIQDPFGEAANQTIGLFNDKYSGFGHIEQAPPMYSNANSTSFPMAAGITNQLINASGETIEFGFSIKPVFKVKPTASSASDSFVGIDMSDLGL